MVEFSQLCHPSRHPSAAERNRHACRRVLLQPRLRDRYRRAGGRARRAWLCFALRTGAHAHPDPAAVGPVCAVGGGMIREELVFVATCDISGHARGKGFPARELPARLRKGVGWTGSNLMMSPFGPIWDTPFGTAGDFMIVPDPGAEVRVDFDDGSAVEHFFLGDICNTDGTAWECCPRDFLRRAVRQLQDVANLRLIAAFEQEFLYTGTDERPRDAYALAA